MKRVELLLLVTFLCQLTFSSCREQNVLTEQELSEGWKLLFDGKSLDGWRNFNEPASSLTTWGVDRGMIISSGTGTDTTGYIITEKQYENFIVTFDWKIEDEGNSGFLYHVLERPGYKVPYATGPEYQIIDNDNFQGTLAGMYMTAADYSMYAPDTALKEVIKPGKWNSSKIMFDNGAVEYWLNGQKTVDFEAWTDDWYERKEKGMGKDFPEYGLSPSGHFALQDHGSRTWFRNIKIRELPGKSNHEVLFNGHDLEGWEIFGTDSWYVENGEIVSESGPDKEYGYLGTRRYYDDFDLSLEFKQVLNGNSGIFIRSYITSGVNISGWQVEIAPPGKDTGGVYESYGRGWLAHIPPEKEGILRWGEWNVLRIKAEGNNLSTWLNGELLTNLTDEPLGNEKGRIMLQVQKGGGMKMRFRNISLQEL